MLQQEKPPSLTEYRVKSGTERPRHVQWSKLSKKRKRKLVQRNLKHLERKAKKKSLSFGLDDYSHVASLVFSQLPYNPNGHHCSCNCIDEILEAPDLAIDGINYGKRLTADSFDNENTAEERRCGSEGDRSCITSRKGSRSQSSGSHGNTNAITDLGVSPRQVCHKCKNAHCIKNILKAQTPNNRRLSIAKEDGSLRSKIYGLRRKIRQYTDEIDDRERKTVQAIVNRRYSIAEQQQLQALKLSDELRALKVKEMFYRSENAQLKERMTEKGETWGIESTGGMTGNQINDKYPLKTDLALRSWLENVEPGDPLGSGVDEDKDSGKSGSGSYSSGRRLSNRSNARMSIAYTLPAVIEEEEEARNSAEFWKDAHLNNQNKSMSYDILWINHNDDDVDEEEEDDEDGEDVFSKTWPMLPKHQEDLVFAVEEDLRSSRSAQSNVTFVKREAENASPVKRLVHRLDSGLTFGFSSPTRQVLDESLVGIKDKIDDEKLAGSKLPEEQYYKPLNERQTSFGSSIRKTIRDEILRRGSLASERRNSAVSDSELESEDKRLREEVTRRRSLVVDERNVQAFVKEAERKDRVVKDEIRRRSVVESGKVDMETDKSDSSGENSENERNKEEVDDDTEEKEGHENEPEDSRGKQNFATIAGKTHVVPNTKLYDLSTLKTVAQKHQTLRTLARLDEDLYKVSDGTEKLNTYRKNQARAKIVKDVAEATPRGDEDAIPMTRKEKIFSIPEPMNSRLLLESDIADNEKVISQLDFKYDMIRDLRFLVMNQNTSRAFSYSYLKAAPPYLKTKWETRIKRGFLRGVKEQKINEKQLETVEGVTYKVIDRDVIHSETLKRAKGKRKNSDNNSSPESRNSASRISASRNSINRRSSSALSTSSGKGRNYKLPPLQLPGSRTPSPMEIADIDYMQTSRFAAPENLPSALRKLSIRHKFQDKDGLMRNVVRLSAYERNFDNGDINGNVYDASLSTNRTTNGNETEERYTPRLNTGRRHSTFVQNVASSDPQSGRVSVNSYDAKRKISQMQAIEEY